MHALMPGLKMFAAAPDPAHDSVLTVDFYLLPLSVLTASAHQPR